ncbi:MAG: DUF4203 domain-containing protein [Spirochaetes bacterium]|nr:DUF4203 domain-containing protein [Spirochaetota bacterium]
MAGELSIQNIKDFFYKIHSPVYDILNKLNDIIYSYGKSTGFITGLILIMSGILLAFWGYRLKKIALLLLGFLIGALIGFYLGNIIDPKSAMLAILLALVLGIVTSLFVNFLYKASIIIIGVMLGFSMGLFISTIINVNTSITFVIAVVSAVIGGFLSIKIEKIMFIVITAYYGYLLFRFGIMSINLIRFDRLFEELLSIAVLIGGAVLQVYEQFIYEKNLLAGENKNTSAAKFE